GRDAEHPGGAGHRTRAAERDRVGNAALAWRCLRLLQPRRNVVRHLADVVEAAVGHGRVMAALHEILQWDEGSRGGHALSRPAVLPDLLPKTPARAGRA